MTTRGFLLVDLTETDRERWIRLEHREGAPTTVVASPSAFSAGHEAGPAHSAWITEWMQRSELGALRWVSMVLAHDHPEFDVWSDIATRLGWSVRTDGVASFQARPRPADVVPPEVAIDTAGAADATSADSATDDEEPDGAPDEAHEFGDPAEPAGRPETVNPPPPPPPPAPPILDLWDDPHVIDDAGSQGAITPVLNELCAGVADSLIDFAYAPPFEVRACSTRGFSHRLNGTPRQDSFATAVTGGWVIVAVADGVSQGRFSHVAADVAARVSVRLLAKELSTRATVDPAAFDGPAFAARVSAAIVKEARHRGLFKLPVEDETDPEQNDALTLQIRRQMATTLFIAAVSTAVDADRSVEMFAVNVAGDCGAYLLRDGALRRWEGGKDAASEISDSSVRPLPGNVQPVAIHGRLADGNALFVVSDGIGDPVESGDTPVGRYLAEQWAAPPNPAALLEQTNFKRRTYDDDRTVVGVWLRCDHD